MLSHSKWTKAGVKRAFAVSSTLWPIHTPVPPVSSFTYGRGLRPRRYAGKLKRSRFVIRRLSWSSPGNSAFQAAFFGLSNRMTMWLLFPG